MKQQIQLSLEAEVIRKLREQNVNISELVNNILLHVIKQQSLTAEEIAMSMLNDEKDRLRYLRKQQVKAVEQTDQLLAQTDEKIKKQELIIQEVRKSERIAELMRQLNERIYNSAYDYEQVKDAPELSALMSYGIPVSEAWLKRHISRIELLGK